MLGEHVCSLPDMRWQGPTVGAQLGLVWHVHVADSSLGCTQLSRLEVLQQQLEALGLSCAEDDGELVEAPSTASPAETSSGWVTDSCPRPHALPASHPLRCIPACSLWRALLQLLPPTYVKQACALSHQLSCKLVWQRFS